VSFSTFRSDTGLGRDQRVDLTLSFSSSRGDLDLGGQPPDPDQGLMEGSGSWEGAALSEPAGGGRMPAALATEDIPTVNTRAYEANHVVNRESRVGVTAGNR
jgi:hypothetical protein